MSKETIKTRIWKEEAEANNPFAARRSICAGYDVFNDILRNASYIDYLYLLIKLKIPTSEQARLLEALAIGLANPGPRDPSVHAAMSAGVGGSTHASCLMAALAVGAGQSGGAREVALSVGVFERCGMDLEKWRSHLCEGYEKPYRDGWGEMEHFPGFDPYGTHCPQTVMTFLDYLAEIKSTGYIAWLKTNRETLEENARLPISMIAVAASAFVDLEMSAAQAEILFLLLRLPGAAAHALEQEQLGWKTFPFFNDRYFWCEESNAQKSMSERVSEI